MLAGVRFGFPQRLFQIGAVGFVFRVDRHVIVPLGAVNGCHGQRNEEWRCGNADILRHIGFYDQI